MVISTKSKNRLRSFLSKSISKVIIMVTILSAFQQKCLGQTAPLWDPLLSYCIDQELYRPVVNFCPISVSASRKTGLGYSFVRDSSYKVNSVSLFFFHGLDTLNKTIAFEFKSLPPDSFGEPRLELQNFKLSFNHSIGNFFSLQHDSWSKNEDTVYFEIQNAILNGNRLKNGYYFFDLKAPGGHFQLHQDQLLNYCAGKEYDYENKKNYCYNISPDRKRVIEFVYFYNDSNIRIIDSIKLNFFNGLDTTQKVNLTTVRHKADPDRNLEINFMNFCQYFSFVQGNIVSLQHDSWSNCLDTFYLKVSNATIADGYYYIDLKPLNTTRQFQLRRDTLLNYCNNRIQNPAQNKTYLYTITPGARRVIECERFYHRHCDSATLYCFDGLDTLNKVKLITLYPSIYPDGDTARLEIEMMDIIFRHSPTNGHFFDLPHNSWSPDLDTFYFGVTKSTINKPFHGGSAYDYFAVPIPLAPIGIQSPPSHFSTSKPLIVSTMPNPLRTFTSLTISLPHPGNVSVSIFNNQGRFVRSFEKQFTKTDLVSLIWDGRNRDGGMLPNGAYNCRIETGGKTAVKRILIMR